MPPPPQHPKSPHLDPPATDPPGVPPPRKPLLDAPPPVGPNLSHHKARLGAVGWAHVGDQ